MSFILNILKALLYGIVQGLTEWFALGAQAHLRLMASFMPLTLFPAAADNLIFSQMFRAAVCFGSVMAVLVMYLGRLNPFDGGISDKEKHSILRLWINILIASLPAFIVGLIVSRFAGDKLQAPAVTGIFMVLSGILLFFSQTLKKKKTVGSLKAVSVKHSAAAGLFNILSVFPGCDHLPGLLAGCTLSGFTRTAAVEFAVFASIPAMFFGSMRTIASLDLSLNAGAFVIILIGLTASFCTSAAVFRKLVPYVKTHDFRMFGLYRVVLGIIVLAASLLGFAA
ncbi:MAG: hypothetical protein K6G61_07855 [Solobacterium sp.]|nr:hypothetical protein [Solobacterium sp.]